MKKIKKIKKIKIKGDIPLKILKSYGFVLNNKEWFVSDINGATVQIKPITREILIASYNTLIYHNPAILYDLIRDGLVEELEEV